MKSKNNIVTEGLSGKIQQLVFSQRFGKTVAGKRPGPREGLASAAQLNTRTVFKEAVAYAKAAIADVAKKMAYAAKAKRGRSAYNVAFVDYFTPPEIGDIDSSQYNGLVGGNIKIVAKDDFKVASVLVRIEKPDGTLVEDGIAHDTGDGMHWIYSSTIAAGNISGNKLIVTATDMPGHSIVKLKTL